ncbi:ATP synthase subunit d, mitochondrial-like [Sycon ciliatum]|uniref:ATP synthase subunit d, mitochondrial-like n=1 Tax=Sycon ciliatum TaxID=27933 RepID=UPI0020AE37D5|eukprot:scpid93895/ scgid15422/ ATP synthase subunit d, mitochondrial
MAAAARVDRKLLSKVFDWTKVLSKVPEGSVARKDLLALRAKHDQLRERLDSHPENAAPIDFDHYRKLIANPGFVDSMEKTYKDLLTKVPYPSDPFTAEISSREKEADKHFATVIAEAKDIAQELQTSLDEFNKLPPFESMTWDDFFDRFPKYEERVDKILFEMNYEGKFEHINDMINGRLEAGPEEAKK